MKKLNLLLVFIFITLSFTNGAFAKHNPDRKLLHYRLALSLAEITKNLQFNFASAEVNPIYNEQLVELAKMLKEDGSAIALRGHADAIGSYVPNWKLSQKRADAVKNFLVKQGVSAEKIVTTPFGSTIPIASNKTASGRQKNRRVEIKLG